jgi:hypothetical protein
MHGLPVVELPHTTGSGTYVGVRLISACVDFSPNKLRHVPGKRAYRRSESIKNHMSDKATIGDMFVRLHPFCNIVPAWKIQTGYV